jgi:hypothetical protein
MVIILIEAWQLGTRYWDVGTLIENKTFKEISVILDTSVAQTANLISQKYFFLKSDLESYFLFHFFKIRNSNHVLYYAKWSICKTD